MGGSFESSQYNNQNTNYKVEKNIGLPEVQYDQTVKKFPSVPLLMVRYAINRKT